MYDDLYEIVPNDERDNFDRFTKSAEPMTVAELEQAGEDILGIGTRAAMIKKAMQDVAEVVRVLRAVNMDRMADKLVEAMLLTNMCAEEMNRLVDVEITRTLHRSQQATNNMFKAALAVATAKSERQARDQTSTGDE
jgi:hypothetical protein